jgi:hypothetical protein
MFYILYNINVREVYGKEMFENRVLRRIFGPKRDKTIGGQSKLHLQEAS